jgi:hypothetical protein
MKELEVVEAKYSGGWRSKYWEKRAESLAAENAALRDAMALGADDLVPTDLWGKA